MLRPSYAELMDVLNKEGEGENVKSRYTIVIAAAKRARQLIDGHSTMLDEENIKVDKALSIAIEEMNEGKIEIVPEGQGTVLVLKKHEEEEAEQAEKADDINADENDEGENDDDDLGDDSDEFNEFDFFDEEDVYDEDDIEEDEDDYIDDDNEE